MRRFLAPLALLLSLALVQPAAPVPAAWGSVYSAFVAVNHTFNAGTSGATETVPFGALHLTIEDCGASGGGGGGDSISGDFGGGGGGGAYVKHVLSLTGSNWGKTFTVTAASAPGQAASAGSSTVANSTFQTSVSLSATGGSAGGSFGSGGAGGSGGGASGGNTANTNGGTGQTGAGGHLGGSGVTGTLCNAPNGGNGNINSGTVGGGATVIFEYS